MKWYYNIISLILSVISALPIILVKSFMTTFIFNISTISLLVIELFFLYGSIILGYIYLLYRNVPLAKFYPIIKLIELLIPVAVGIIYYKAKLSPINYFGIFLAIAAIICIELK